MTSKNTCYVVLRPNSIIVTVDDNIIAVFTQQSYLQKNNQFKQTLSAQYVQNKQKNHLTTKEKLT